MFLKEAGKIVLRAGFGSSADFDIKAVAGWVDAGCACHQSGGTKKPPVRRMKTIIRPGQNGFRQR